MTFEYDKIKIFGTMKLELIYFFDSSIIVDPILAGRKSSGTCGSLVRSTLLVVCCVKAISIHVITNK